MNWYKKSWKGASSVKDPVNMLAIKEIGKNIPILKLTYYIEEAEKWLMEKGKDNYEIVRVVITPYK